MALLTYETEQDEMKTDSENQTSAKFKYAVIDDSHGESHGKKIYESNSREDANNFFTRYEAMGNNVAILTRN